MFGTFCWVGNISKFGRGSLENMIGGGGGGGGGEVKPLDSTDKTHHEKRVQKTNVKY